MSFWDRSVEFKALIISSIAASLAIIGTSFLFWHGRPDIPLGIIISGAIVVLTWLFSFIYLKKNKEPKIKVDVILIYVRLFLIVALAITFAVLKLTIGFELISPIFLVIGYLFVSLTTLFAFYRKDKNVR